MGASYLMCSATGMPACDSPSAFEAWLGREFPDARIVERGGSGTRALVWMNRDYGTGKWLEGWIRDDRAAIYLEGDLDLICDAAMRAREVFPTDSAVVFTGDWQGIPFDLRLLSDATALAAAVERGDEGLVWRENGPG